MKRFFAAGVVMAMTICSVAATPKNISLLELITAARKFDKTAVIVPGYLKFTHTGPVLFLSRDDGENVILENMIPLQPLTQNDPLYEASKRCEGKYVRVRGIFNAYKEKDVVISKGYLIYGDVVLSTEFFKSEK